MNTVYPKRSIQELDEVIDEIIERNPEWVEELYKLIDEKLNDERTV